MARSKFRTVLLSVIVPFCFLQIAAADEDTTSVTRDTATARETVTTAKKKKAAVSQKSSAVKKGKSAAQATTPAVQKTPPVVQATAPAVQKSASEVQTSSPDSGPTNGFNWLTFRGAVFSAFQSGGSSFSGEISWNPFYRFNEKFGVRGNFGASLLNQAGGGNFAVLEYAALFSYDLNPKWNFELGGGAQSWFVNPSLHSGMISFLPAINSTRKSWVS